MILTILKAESRKGTRIRTLGRTKPESLNSSEVVSKAGSVDSWGQMPGKEDDEVTVTLCALIVEGHPFPGLAAERD
jgi:hypothetical protein